MQQGSAGNTGTATIQRIAFIGVGRMGGPMAEKLRGAGFDVRVYDTSPEARVSAARNGLTVIDSASGAADGADAILLMLPDDEALRSVMEGDNGLLGGLRPDQVVIDMSTSKLATSRRIAALVADKGAAMLDAPVSGGEKGAQAGTLSIMVGGPPEAFDRCRSVFEPMSSVVTYLGGNGLGLIAKYVNQMLMEAAYCAVAEAFTLAAKADADLQAVYQAVRNGLGGSRVLDLMAPEIMSGDYGSGRELTLHHKDGGYALAAGEELEAWTPVTRLTHDIFTEALEQGSGANSAAAVARVFERRTGVQLHRDTEARDADS